MGCGKSKDSSGQEVQKLGDGPKCIFVVGGPGSGKGTYCVKLAKDKNLPHLSTGDLLRAEKSSGSELAAEINEYISKGALVPTRIVIQLLRNEFEKETRKLFLIDGFPRNQENHDVWDEMCKDIEVHMLLNFVCPEEELIRRILSRGQGREDDNEEVLKTRLQSFKTETLPVVEIYRKKGKVCDIDTNREMDVVYPELLKLVS